MSFHQKQPQPTQTLQMRRNRQHHHSTTSVSHRSEPHISYIFLKIYEIKTFISDTCATNIHHELKAQSCSEKVPQRDKPTSALGATGWFLLMCFCSTTSLVRAHPGSHQFCLKLSLTKIFLNPQEGRKYNPKYQTGCKPLLEWQNHLLDRR